MCCFFEVAHKFTVFKQGEKTQQGITKWSNYSTYYALKTSMHLQDFFRANLVLSKTMLIEAKLLASGIMSWFSNGKAVKLIVQNNTVYLATELGSKVEIDANMQNTIVVHGKNNDSKQFQFANNESMKQFILMLNKTEGNELQSEETAAVLNNAQEEFPWALHYK